MTSSDLSKEFQSSTAGRAEVLQDVQKWLQLDKLTVIRGGWKLPDTFEYARKSYYEETSLWYGGKENEPYYKEKRAAFDEQVALASDSLRKFIAQQDQEMADKLSTGDLKSLIRFGHAVLRSESTQPVSAVVVFDSLGEGVKPDRDWALSQFFVDGRFADAWSKEKPAEALSKLPISDFIENFDINPLDLYAHQVLMRVHYALKHEHMLTNISGRLDEERTKPRHQRFARQTEYEYPQEYAPYSAQREYKPAAQTEAEVNSFDYLTQYDYDNKRTLPFGRDSDFYAKLVRLEALEALTPFSFDGVETLLRRFEGERNRGWMRYYGREGEEIPREALNKEQSEAIVKELREKIIEAHKEGRPDEEDARLNTFKRLFDLRVLAPTFKKFYAADESKGAARAVLNIINEAVTKYFPTLAAAPIPGWTAESEPPKNIEGYKKPTAPSGAKPAAPAGPSA